MLGPYGSQSSGYERGGSGVCVGDGQAEAEGVPPQGAPTLCSDLRPISALPDLVHELVWDESDTNWWFQRYVCDDEAAVGSKFNFVLE